MHACIFTPKGPHCYSLVHTATVCRAAGPSLCMHVHTPKGPHCYSLVHTATICRAARPSLCMHVHTPKGTQPNEQGDTQGNMTTYKEV
jgi:hypothetical protein